MAFICLYLSSYHSPAFCLPAPSLNSYSKPIVIMMTKFDYAIPIILMNEGKFANDPADPGGATNYGISLRFLLSERMDIDNDGHININDIKGITKEKATMIYKSDWWEKYKYNEIQDKLIAAKIFDTAVHCGASESHKIAQRTANQLGGPPLIVDGKLGKKSRDSINALIAHGKGSEYLSRYRQNLELFTRNLVRDRPILARFLNDWLRRARQ